jgi:hypothetical protein
MADKGDAVYALFTAFVPIYPDRGPSSRGTGFALQGRIPPTVHGPSRLLAILGFLP